MSWDAATPGAPASPPPKPQLAKIRHELRTPINHIIGYSELLAEEAGPQMPASFRLDLQKIQQGGQRLLALMAEFFDEEKYVARQLTLHEVFHELRTPVNHILGYTEMLQEQATELGLDTVVADLGKIHGAAVNWLKLMEQHLVPLTVPTADGQRLPEGADAPKLVYDSETVFLTQAMQHRPGVQPPTGALLLVDDDASNRDLLARRLRRQGHTVTLAESGQQALALLCKHPFDLVLLDMLMPKMDGDVVLQQLKETPSLRDIPVIMISAMDDLDSVVKCILLGAEDYLSKPFNPVLLQARIGAALEKKRLRDQEQVYLEQIHVEQAKSERLLLNILPKSIADRLKAGENTIADSLPEVTVLFADLVDFTTLAGKISSRELIRLLDEIFTAFDGLAWDQGLEKIKTIGDSYMVVGGLPTPRADHAEAIAELALNMQAASRKLLLPDGTPIRLRIGINTGPVIAGVIGKHKFSYDLWGDTVNIASRMESHGRPGQIQLAQATYERLRGKYAFQRRGQIQIKGKGRLSAWFLTGRIQEQSSERGRLARSS